ncbi:hypothetical protein FRC02_009616 [Tulasnella sp. 418]|nr:hypothetical protein FRC02_009616 [Tulasnella sp. 418]
MPSTHSAAISFYATYITVASLCLPSRGPFTSIPKTLPPIIFIPWASSVACSRIWLGYHTGAQVIAGVSVGVVTALVWFKLWTSGADVIVTDIVHRILALIPFL